MTYDSMSFDENKPIKLPADIEIYESNGTSIAYSCSINSWVVLSTVEEFFCFKLLMEGSSLADTINIAKKKGLPEKILQNVLAELIDKHYFSTNENTVNNLLNLNYSTITCNITDACNLRCITCFKSCENSREIEIDTQQWISILDQHASIGGKALRISGGEPLLKLEMVSSLIKFAKSHNYDTAILTNGTLLNATAVELLEESGIDRIQVSLDGPTEKSNDSVRGMGTFSKVMDALKLLSKTKIEVFVAMVPVPGYSDQAFFEYGEQFSKQLETQFNGRIFFNIAQGIIDGRNIKKSNAPLFIRKCGTIQDMMGENNSAAALDLWRFNPGQRTPTCGYACQLTVESDGLVKNCAIGENIGNVIDIGLEYVIAQLRNNAECHLVDDLEMCKKCALRNICGGPCRIDPQVCTREMRSLLVSRIAESNKFRYSLA